MRPGIERVLVSEFEKKNATVFFLVNSEEFPHLLREPAQLVFNVCVQADRKYAGALLGV